MNEDDSDSAKSEKLQVLKYKYTPTQTPEPEITQPSSSPETGESRVSNTSNVSEGSSPRRKKIKRKKSKNLPDQRDVVLFRHFAPNNPEFVKGVGSRIYNLPSSSSEESESEEDQMEGAVHVPIPAPAHNYTPGIGFPPNELVGTVSAIASSVGATALALSSGQLKRPRDETRWPSTVPDGLEIHRRSSSGSNIDMERRKASIQRPLTLITSQSDPTTRMRNVAAVGLLELGKDNSPSRQIPIQDNLATSPILLPHIMSPSQGAPGQTLPAMTADSLKGIETSTAPKQGVNLPPVRPLIRETRIASERSRPRASSYSSVSTITGVSPPPGHRILPQLPQQVQSAPFPAGPPLSRASTIGPHSVRSPVDNLGDTGKDLPRVVPERRPYQRRAPPRPAESIPSLISHKHSSSNKSVASTSVTTSTSASTSTEAFSPDSHATATEPHTSEGTPQSSTGAQQPATYLHYPSVPIGGYRCQHEGCDAPPFSTQYLLNSHANVHSQDRPHYCPVENCTRGKGGKGFKRKNEMIRHGLVHESPGYVCPWCPDREYRYPRPDNLQRHVRMHHEEKNRDDPKLQAVLSKRPIGGNSRSRKRRN